MRHERLHALRSIPARRQIRKTARIEDMLSLDAICAMPQQRLGPRDGRLRRVRSKLMGKRQRGREHVLAIRERSVVQSLQEWRVGRVCAAAEQ
jgi:hypothetical protein